MLRVSTATALLLLLLASGTAGQLPDAAQPVYEARWVLDDVPLLVPEKTTSIMGNVTLWCQEPGVEVSMIPRTLTVSAEAAPGFGAVVTPASFSWTPEPSVCSADATTDVAVQLLVTTPISALHGPTSVTVTAEMGDAMGPENTVIPLQIARIAEWKAGFAQTVYQTSAGGKVQVPLNVTNKGNAAILVTATEAKEQHSRLLDSSLPEPFVVDAFSSNEVKISVLALKDSLGYENRREVFSINLVPSPAPGTSEWPGDATLQLNAVIQVQGIGAATPGPAFPAFLAALGVLAWSARRYS